MTLHINIIILIFIALIPQGVCGAEEESLQYDHSPETMNGENETEDSDTENGDGQITHNLFATIASISIPGVASGGDITLAFIPDFDKERVEVTFTTKEGQSSKEIAQAAVEAIKTMVSPIPEAVFVSLDNDIAQINVTSHSHIRMFFNSSTDVSFSAPPVVEEVEAKVEDGNLKFTFDRGAAGIIEYYVLESETVSHRIETDNDDISFKIDNLWHMDESSVHFRIISVGASFEYSGVNRRFYSVSRLFSVDR